MTQHRGTRFWLSRGVVTISAATLILFGGTWGATPRAAAQQKKMKAAATTVPSITGVFPPGATIGRSTEWTVRGLNLDKVERFLVSGEGVEVVRAERNSDGSFKLTARVASDATAGLRELRADGPDGISNLALVKVDRLPQTVEAEPNDERAKATKLARGTVAAGILKPLDLDYFELRGRRGERVTIEVEARRLGTPVIPVVSVLAANGRSLMQERETRGIEHDCRLSFTPTMDGVYYVLVRDHVYAGGESACYRLIVEDAPYATGLFPMGGQRGQTVTFTVSGGNLPSARSKSVTMPDEPGVVFDPGPFDGPGGPVASPFKIVAGDGPEINEPAGSQGPVAIALGVTVNGRIERPGEVDAYRIDVKKGERVRFKVQASTLGSWLDSVITVRDAAGNVLGENDDPPAARSAGNTILGLAIGDADSTLDFDPKQNGPVFVEVSDRFGDGGPAYSYRLSTGLDAPDFEIRLLLGNPSTAQAAAQKRINIPVAAGAFNLKPGTKTPLNFVVTPHGDVGSIEVHVEGLPAGVTSSPVKISLPAAQVPAKGKRKAAVLARAENLVLTAAADAEPSVSDIRVVGVAKSPRGTITRVATAALPLVTAPTTTSSTAVPSRVVTRLPAKVLGVRRPNFVGPLQSLTLHEVVLTGVVLQGGRADVLLELAPRHLSTRDVRIEATPRGKGLRATGVVEEAGSSGVGGGLRTSVRVFAEVDCAVGLHTVDVKIERPNVPGETIRTSFDLLVEPPLRLGVRPGAIVAGRDGVATIDVTIDREAGFDGPAELRVEGLPEGFRVPGRFTVERSRTVGYVRVARAPGAAKAGEGGAPVSLRVIGVARLALGLVKVEAPIQPILRPSIADK